MSASDIVQVKVCNQFLVNVIVLFTKSNSAVDVQVQLDGLSPYLTDVLGVEALHLETYQLAVVVHQPILVHQVSKFEDCLVEKSKPFHQSDVLQL